MVYVIQVCWQLASRIRTELQWKIPDDGRRNCPKRVEFNSKNKFAKLMHLVGFIIRIYHDARSPERQICWLYVVNKDIFSFPHPSRPNLRHTQPPVQRISKLLLRGTLTTHPYQAPRLTTSTAIPFTPPLHLDSMLQGEHNWYLSRIIPVTRYNSKLICETMDRW